ncbi:MAG: nitronate monooxygenase [Chloroflexota bacterium]
MKKTRICDLFGIRHPIIQGGMGWVASAELAAAVSNAGGLGMLSPSGGGGKDQDQVENLRNQIRKTRDLTDKPFGVNIGLEDPKHKEFVETTVKEGVRIMATAAGSPALFTKYLKERGISVMHPAFSVRHARRGEAEGLDAIIASGVEAGGLLSREELTTMVIVPQVADAVNIPVIAAGGIVDARGAVAAFALGAEAVQMGTRFIATTECVAHPRYKEAILKAIDSDTAITGKRGMIPARCIRNKLALRVLEMDGQGVSYEEMLGFIGRGRLRMAALDGDMDEGSIFASAASGMISEILPVKEIIQRIVEDYDRVVAALGIN